MGEGEDPSWRVKAQRLTKTSGNEHWQRHPDDKTRTILSCQVLIFLIRKVSRYCRSPPRSHAQLERREHEPSPSKNVARFHSTTRRNTIPQTFILSLFSLLRHIKSFNWMTSVGNSQILNEREISRPVRNSGKFRTNSRQIPVHSRWCCWSYIRRFL